MSTEALRRHPHRDTHVGVDLSAHWTWLAIGFALAFAVPFVLTDLLDINRDLFYGLYAASVLALFGSWAHATGYDLRAAIARRWIWAAGLGVICGAGLGVMVVRTEATTTRPDGIAIIGAVLWRGVVYGATDGLFLSAFPILVVFAAFAGTRLRARRGGTVAVGTAALLASLAMTAVYHAGYSDFRSGKIRKPLAGDVVWSIPTLATLNPIGAPIAHIGLHVSAVLHSYQTDTFLPPHS